MAQDHKKQVEQITGHGAGLCQMVYRRMQKGVLIEYSSVKGLFILRPYGYALWENIIQAELDRRFKERGTKTSILRC
jgi:prolyl-tRNA synthetase